MKNSDITGSVKERILYGLGTAAFTLGPLLIPGISFYELGIGLLGFTSITFAVLCLLAAIKSVRNPPPRRRSR